MPREQISNVLLNKLKKYYTLTLDTNNDGLVNWSDFEAAIEVGQAKRKKKLFVVVYVN